jgi:hypothetical protein
LTEALQTQCFTILIIFVVVVVVDDGRHRRPPKDGLLGFM